MGIKTVLQGLSEKDLSTVLALAKSVKQNNRIIIHEHNPEKHPQIFTFPANGVNITVILLFDVD